MSPHPRKREPKSATWEDRLSAQVGRNIAASRARQGVTAQQLSDRLNEIGCPIPRPTISQIENGQRAVSLAEAIAIAAALAVPPNELVFDPADRAVEALPGRDDLTGEEADAWMAGEIPMRPAGKTRAAWFARLKDHYGREGSLSWILLGRMERWLYGLDAALTDQERRVLALPNGPARANAVAEVQHTVQSAANQAAALLRQARSLESEGLDRLDPETAALASHYRSLDLERFTAADPALFSGQTQPELKRPIDSRDNDA